MSYRFQVNGTDVSCDTPDELRLLLLQAPPVTRDARSCGKRKRAPKPKRARAKSSAAGRGRQQSAVSRGWAVAQYFADKHPGTTVAAARSHLAAHPKLREKTDKAYAKSLA